MGERVSFNAGGGMAEGYLAVPDRDDGDLQSGNAPGVIVIQEWWGLVGHITSVADRFASEGFIAFAPDLYRGATTSEPDEAMRLLMGMAMDQAARDIAGAARYVAELPECTGKVGAIGFCAGGSLALWAAALSDEVSSAVGFYPYMPWDRINPQWSKFSGKRAIIHCDEADGTSAAPAIQFAKNAIEDAGGECVAFDYPGTEHAFFNDDRPEVYDHEASTLAWARSLEHLRKCLW